MLASVTAHHFQPQLRLPGIFLELLLDAVRQLAAVLTDDGVDVRMDGLPHHHLIALGVEHVLRAAVPGQVGVQVTDAVGDLQVDGHQLIPVAQQESLFLPLVGAGPQVVLVVYVPLIAHDHPLRLGDVVDLHLFKGHRKLEVQAWLQDILPRQTAEAVQRPLLISLHLHHTGGQPHQQEHRHCARRAGSS